MTEVDPPGTGLLHDVGVLPFQQQVQVVIMVTRLPAGHLSIGFLADQT